MYNWSSDLKSINKKSASFAVFSLEQAINFGLKNTKLSEVKLKQYWNRLTLDPKKRQFLSFILWGKQS